MNIYKDLFDIVKTYIYGGTLVSGSPEELVCTLVSTCAVLFCIALPFVVVLKVVRMICG